MKTLLIACAIATTATLLNAEGPRWGTNTQSPPSQPGTPQHDQQLSTKIKEALSLAFGKYKNVNVYVSKGTVTLSGTVDSQEDKDRLDKIVNSVSGFMKVDNQVTVQTPEAQAKPSS